MRIVDRATFLALPPPVLYQKIRHRHLNCDYLAIMTEVLEFNDWVYADITQIDYDDSNQLCQQIDQMWADPTASYPINPDESTCRDGCFEGNEVRFLIYEAVDVDRLIKILQRCTEA